MNVFFVLLVIAWLFLAFFVFRADTPFAAAFRPHLVALLGVVFVLGSFFLLPWLCIDLTRYVDLPVPGAVGEALLQILGLLGLKHIKGFLEVVARFTSPNGWQLQLIPVYGLTTRLAILLPSLIALLAVFWLPWGTTLAGGKACKVVGACLVLLTALALIGLAQAIPVLDAMAVPEWELALLPEPWSDMPGQLPAVLLGIRLDSGPWLTFVGLCLLLCGGLIEIFGPGSSGTGGDVEDMPAW